MSENVEKKIPEIRFKGFSDDWEKRKLNQLCFRKSKTSNGVNLPHIEFENIISERGKIDKEAIELIGNDKKGIKFTPNNILFGKLRPYLKKWLFPNFEGIAVGDFWVLQVNNLVDPSFLYILIQTKEFQNIANFTSGTKMPRSDWNLVSNHNFKIPVSINEQKKIGMLFKKLDNLITVNQQKLEKLKLLKRALLQQLFPQNDEINPRIRFTNFNGEWEKHKLNELIKYEQPTEYIVKDTQYKNDNKTPVLTAGKSFILGYTDENFGIKELKKQIPKNL
ncbi:restriction endonuclease subunit S [Fructilactobacillus hinvesii]|uniref:Restriction endonuclease subunit S n=1 Tax=Fructilactobacillus hinvesii TaxID=2940300 RepID=A0ABY5BXF6_9LACO|nr:restriction endonuclease subunit S [Fructilactobacillus hinvesii]USS88348.1 restriction endonuclease subunit S [Fructilactobacillus hinvesii]